jgi:hypothetical protein
MEGRIVSGRFKVHFICCTLIMLKAWESTQSNGFDDHWQKH